jgi:DNA (cytosine-5)-methyltransferase 1
MIKYIDLFAGVGGFHYGIDKAWEHLQVRRSSGNNLSLNGNKSNNSLRQTRRDSQYATCVYSNEYDKYANSVYKKHYERCDDRDIRTVKTSEIPDHDLLVGGFPCQAFSVAGKRRGFEDTRGTLFFEIARIAKQKQPRLLLLENVKGLLSHDSGNTFKTILRSLDELGYDCQWQVLNSKDFSVPQNRERVFIIGHLRGTPRPEVFPITVNDSETTQRRITAAGINNPSRGYEIRKDGLASSLRATEMGSKNFIADIRQLNQPTHSNDRVYGDDGLSTTIASQAGGQGAKTELYAIPVLTPNREKRQEGRRFKTNGEPSFTLTGQDIHGVAVQEGKLKSRKISNCLDANYYKGLDNHQARTGVLENLKIRRLTPVECERLQGFPDNWTKYGQDNKEMSDTQRYKQMGNAVTTNVVTAIISKLIE